MYISVHNKCKYYHNHKIKGPDLKDRKNTRKIHDTRESQLYFVKCSWTPYEYEHLVRMPHIEKTSHF